MVKTNANPKIYPGFHFFWTSKWCHCFRDMKRDNLIVAGPFFIFNLICSFCLSSFCTAAPSIYESKLASVEDTSADVPWTDKSTSKDKRLLLYSFDFWKHTWQDYWQTLGCFITNEKCGSEIPCVFRESKWKIEAFCGFDPHTSSWSKTNVDCKPLLWASTNVRGTLDTNLTHSPTSRTLIWDQINHGTVFIQEGTNKLDKRVRERATSTLLVSAPLKQFFFSTAMQSFSIKCMN